MKQEYSEWIQSYLELHPHGVAGMCAEASNLMRAVFPELRLVGGYVKTAWGYDLHYWCTTPEDEIVDPTASQFPGLKLEDYEDGHSTDAITLLLARQMVIVGKQDSVHEEQHREEVSGDQAVGEARLPGH